MNLPEEFFSGPGGTKDMNLEKDFILREMAGEYVIIPTGKRAPLQEGLLTVNEVGAALWKELERGADFQELLASVLAQYEVEEDEGGKGDPGISGSSEEERYIDNGGR